MFNAAGTLWLCAFGGFVFPFPPPPVQWSDLERFPRNEAAQGECKRACDHGWFLRHEREADECWFHQYQEFWLQRLDEAEFSREAWGLLSKAYNYKSEDFSTEPLDDLRRLLGSEAYYRGEMPPAVPLKHWIMFYERRP